ncbi:olfactory receptor 8S1-like [Dasypus novemcinctus]|uniref:olfactory receptor 8S1-like n=1 Tax=Dasypus novemcinctus TaxID=9361 RepID=UPI0039C8DA5F
MALGNHSAILEFVLLGLSTDPRIQALLFVLFLVFYILTLMGNLLMLLIVRADPQLHTPMYFFLSHLSFLDFCFSSATVPKLLENLLYQTKTISVGGCLAQVFFLLESGGTEACLLSAMAYDRYVAICHPLLYGQMMSDQLCKGLVWGSWGLGFLDAFVNSLLAMNLDFCGDDSIPHYSCELPSPFSLSCSDITTNITLLFCSSVPHALGTCLLIFFSYAYIVSTILSMSSSSGKSKAFSTCSSHLTAVLLFYGSSFVRYLMPTSGSPLELIFSIQYSVVTPLVNPLIYSLKNNEVKAAAHTNLKMPSAACPFHHVPEFSEFYPSPKVLEAWATPRWSTPIPPIRYAKEDHMQPQHEPFCCTKKHETQGTVDEVLQEPGG